MDPLTYYALEHRDDILPGHPYCDYCEEEGHTFRSCPRRDDELDES